MLNLKILIVTLTQVDYFIWGLVVQVVTLLQMYQHYLIQLDNHLARELIRKDVLKINTHLVVSE